MHPRTRAAVFDNMVGGGSVYVAGKRYWLEGDADRSLLLRFLGLVEGLDELATDEH